MPFLIAAVVLVGAIATLNLLLTVGVIRRLREHTSQLAGMGPAGPPGLEAGQDVGTFVTSAVDGTPVTDADLESYALVSVMSPGCGPCEEKLPKLVKMLESGELPKRSLLAVVAAGDADDARPMVEALSGLTVVVREEPVGGAVQASLGIRAYPTMFTTEHGKVSRIVHDLEGFKKDLVKA